MSESAADTRGVKRSRQACLNCRRKKVKCHGERPKCSFCARLLQECVYPSRRWTTTSDERPMADSAPVDTHFDHDWDSKVALMETELNPYSHGIDRYMNGVSTADKVNEPSSSWHSSNVTFNDAASLSSTGLPNPQQSTVATFTSDPTILPPTKVLLSTVDLYFEMCHGQPYCFFHEQNFRQQLMSDQLPRYLLFAVLTIASRFSLDPYYIAGDPHAATKYASEAWKEIVRQCFDCEEGMSHQLVQATTLLAIVDFTACKHETAWIKIGVAVSMAQSLHMMKEPSTSLSFAAQEERRRTLWSIYLLDKMATCGRDRPSLFLDQTIDLQLPCSDAAFWMSTFEKVVTLEGFNSLDDSQITKLAPSALTIVLVSVLSQAANYAFKHNKSDGQKPPWDHASEYQVICSQLTRFETIFDSYGDIHELILDESRHFDGSHLHITESLIFSYTLYNLCYCLLQHPFLLRRRLEDCTTRIPTRFFAQAIQSSSNHAQEISRTLMNAATAKYRVSATFFGYSSLVAGSINGLFQHSDDETIRAKSAEALLGNLEHLAAKAKYWKTSKRMVNALAPFSRDSYRYSPLIDVSLQSVPLGPLDVERLYSLCDYGTMCSSRIKDISHTAVPGESDNIGLDFETLLHGHTPVGASNNFEHFGDFSGIIQGIIPQFFDQTTPQTTLDGFSFALGEFAATDRSATSHAWHGPG